jgi:hypothetical protein
MSLALAATSNLSIFAYMFTFVCFSVLLIIFQILIELISVVFQRFQRKREISMDCDDLVFILTFIFYRPVGQFIIEWDIFCKNIFFILLQNETFLTIKYSTLLSAFLT